MKIKLTNVPVSDQQKALTFYTEVLGFVKKNDIPMGEHKWLTVVSAEEPEGVELLLVWALLRQKRTRRLCLKQGFRCVLFKWMKFKKYMSDWKSKESYSV